MPTDVTKEEQTQALMARAVDEFGGIDVLVLCAGMSKPLPAPSLPCDRLMLSVALCPHAGIGAHHVFADTKDLSIFHKLMSVNFAGDRWLRALPLRMDCALLAATEHFLPDCSTSVRRPGYLNCTHAAYPHLCASKGVLVAITSFSGEVRLSAPLNRKAARLASGVGCLPHSRLLDLPRPACQVGLPYRTAYCASKFAVTGFLEALRAEMEVCAAARLAHSRLPRCCVHYRRSRTHCM